MASRKTAYIPEADRGTIRARVPRDDAKRLGKHWRCKPSEAIVLAVRVAARDLPPRPLTDDEEREAYAGDQRHDAMRERDD